ncbi:MAG: hypothetical protein OHK0023_25630 [Anaerolineae bacterium]
MSKQTTSPSDTSWAVRANRWALAWSRNWLKVILVLLAIFVSLPFVAPLAMWVGATGVGNFLYDLYSPLCHTFAFRSWFIGGDNGLIAVYPRATANVPSALTYDTLLEGIIRDVGRVPPENTPLPPDQWYAREFRGNPTLGYKVAICQRDISIYLGLLIGGIIYARPRVRKYLRPVPIWLYVWLGLGPIGIDGFSQLLSGRLWEQIRETTPTFRVITGLLFGLMNAWLALPYLEATARETMQEIEAKFARREARLKGLSQ